MWFWEEQVRDIYSFNKYLIEHIQHVRPCPTIWEDNGTQRKGLFSRKGEKACLMFSPDMKERLSLKH